MSTTPRVEWCTRPKDSPCPHSVGTFAEVCIKHVEQGQAVIFLDDLPDKEIMEG